jgi:hypothetical protein
MRHGDRATVSLVFAMLAAAGLLALPGSALARHAAALATASGWQSLTHVPPFKPGPMFLLTDGTVLVQDLGSNNVGTPNWWRLTPDPSGSYVDGTWSQAPALPSNYGPGYYAAAILPDGRLAIAGGEYNNGNASYTNLGAVFDPVANAWTMIPPPNGGQGDWSQIGDAPSEVLADGRWLVGDWRSTDDAILDPVTLSWSTTGGKGKVIGNGEAAFTLLPDGRVLTVDVVPPACTTRSTEILDPATLVWSSAGLTPAPLVECGKFSEIGPQLLMYDGRVFVDGATDATALYDSASGTWSAGPSLPTVGGQKQGAGDTGAALLPDGNVLLATRAAEDYAGGAHFFLFDGTSLTQLPDTATAESGGIFYMLILPTGQVLANVGSSGGLEIFTDTGSPNPAWAPSITSVPTTLAAGQTYTLDGDQLNGLSDGSGFGDDFQNSTNYPLVQIANDDSGTVTYARTSKMANRSIAPGALSCTNFTLPSGIPTGASELRVIANGIASPGVAVTVGTTGANTTSCAPSLVARPTVSGVPAVGRLLSSSPGTWTNATTYTYQWQRCAADGGGCTNIAGATAPGYTPTDADAGGTLRSTVQASNGNSSAPPVTSDPTPLIAPAPVVTGLPHVSGRPVVGHTLTTTAGTWDTTVSVAYEWLRCTRAGSGCTPIAGAAASSYRLTNSDAGHKLQARVSATNAAGGAAEALSALTTLVVRVPRIVAHPHIEGRPVAGQRLRAHHGAWSGPPTSYRYRWLRCSRTGGKCSSIERATRAAYRLTRRDARHRLRVRVVAVNAAGSTRATSPATRIVAVPPA